ncbi:MAG: HAD family hydrolase [Sutterella wadsworthensis]|uniref:HAD family hydrolase n=1 Tax=Sutterella wadsworthensis TaxID=40545 RepID=UPI0013F5FE61|nr:HAD-IA family hydrolase [Sutterella wadsworthensis]
MFYERSCFIFDLDGTLIDSLGVWSQVDQELMRRLSNGRVMLSEDEAGTLRIRAMKTYGEGSDAYFKYMADLKRAFDLPGTPEEIHFQRYSLAQEFLRTRVHYREGAAELIKYLKALGKKLAIVTTTRRRNIDVYASQNKSMIAAAPLSEIMDLIVTRDDVAHVKPDPEGFYKVLDALKAEPEECIMVEDALPGIRGAKSAGIDSVVIEERHNADDRVQLEAAALARFASPAALLKGIQAEIEAAAGGIHCMRSSS